MRRIPFVVLGGLVISLLSCSFIWAQATAQMVAPLRIDPVRCCLA